MKYLVHHDAVLAQPPEGPLVPYLESFAVWVSEQGYAACSLRSKVRTAAGFSKWLEHNGVGIRRIRPEHVTAYLRYRARINRSNNGAQTTLESLLHFLRSNQVAPAEQASERLRSPIELCLQDYVTYLREVRALAEGTIITYVPFVRAFLVDCFRDGKVTLSCLCARDILRFVRHHAHHLRAGRAKNMTKALRSFLRYVSCRGDVALDLAAAVPVVPNWSMPDIPRAIAPDQTRRLLASIDRRTAVGRRDYAILLVLARLGLRAGEVVALELEDIDWTEGCLTIRSCNGLHNELPLPTDVGTAIAAYLRNGRPSSSCRRVFLRARAPITGFTSSAAVANVVRHSLRRAGIDSPTGGAHQFRHGLATDMLRHGASLDEIGQLLGHNCPQSTTIYAKVDIKALRTLAVPWPGGKR